MRHFFSKILCVLAAISLFDGHVAIVQSVAWINMLNDRIPEQGIEEAFDTTFSGEYPCEQCRALAEAKQAERQEQGPVEETKNTSRLVLAPHYFKRCQVVPPHSQRIRFDKLGELCPESWYGMMITPPPQFG